MEYADSESDSWEQEQGQLWPQNPWEQAKAQAQAQEQAQKEKEKEKEKGEDAVAKAEAEILLERARLEARLQAWEQQNQEWLQVHAQAQAQAQEVWAKARAQLRARARADEEEALALALANDRPPSSPSYTSGMESPPEPSYWHRGTLVPNADVQIIRWDRSRAAVLCRLSDILYDRGHPTSQIFNWDWIDGSKLAFNSLVCQLQANGYLLDGEELWWSPRPLGSWSIERLREPSTDETVITSFNARTTIKQSIASHYPHLQFPSQLSAGMDGCGLRERPFFTIVIRPYDAARKITFPSYPPRYRNNL